MKFLVLGPSLVLGPVNGQTKNQGRGTSLFPAGNRLALRRTWTKLKHLDSETVWIGRVRNRRIVRPHANLFDHDAALLQGADNVLQILDVQAKVIETGPTIGVGLLKFDEGVAAHLDVRERRLSGRVAHGKRLA